MTMNQLIWVYKFQEMVDNDQRVHILDHMSYIVTITTITLVTIIINNNNNDNTRNNINI